MAPSFGLILANRAVVLGAIRARDLLDLAATAEASGVFDAVWVGDSLLAKPRLEAVTLLSAAGIDRRAALQALRPLCLTSAQNAFEMGPEAALTGPVQRGDAETIRTHVAALAGCPRPVAELYRASARALVDIAQRRGLSVASAVAIERAIEG